MAREETFVKVSGFLDSQTEVIGDINFKDSFRIDGKFKGKIKQGSSLIIGESGDVDADIEVENISINGKLKGTVVAKEKIEIFANGTVTGKLVTAKLIKGMSSINTIFLILKILHLTLHRNSVIILRVSELHITL